MEYELTFKKRVRLGALLYRDGPSSFEDEKALIGEKGTDDDPPLGLNALLPDSAEVNKDILSGVAGSEVLIVYMARIGSSEVENTVDRHNLDLLIKSGANVNFRDLHGQTVMHEVALRWPIGLAEYCLSQGGNLNHGDMFGRTPLHVATSTNAPDMVRWLINNGANVEARTKGESQTAIHYAAKYNAVDVIPILLESGAKINDRDYKERTPIQLAAETGREEAARLLLSIGAPSGVYDDTGTSCLTHMIANMPDVAANALEQFFEVDKASRMAFYYLSYLETEKWQMIRKNCDMGSREMNRREPLEEIINQKETRLIMHPVIQRLIVKKRELFGTRYFYTNLLINFVFTAIWTVLTYALPKIDINKAPKHIDFYTPFEEKIWRVVLELVGLSMALYFAIKVRIESGEAIRLFQEDKFYRKQETWRDYQYCHPRWPQEESYVRKKMLGIEKEAAASFYDTWYYIDTLSYVGLVFATITRFVIMVYTGQYYGTVVRVHYYSYPVILIVIWLRLMQSFRPFITFGPFIAMMSYVFADTIKFAFLFFEFYIPYCCAIWIIFGGPNAGDDFKQFNDLMFEVFRMTIVDSFQFSQLTEEHKTVAQIVCGTYFALCSITLLNLYIALLSETFAAIFGNATATAYMLQGEVLINAERKMNTKTREKLKTFIATKCSPEAVFESQESELDDMSAMREIKSEIDGLKRQCTAIRKLQQEMRPQMTSLKKEAVSILQSQETIMKEFEEGLRQINQVALVAGSEEATAS